LILGRDQLDPSVDVFLQAGNSGSPDRATVSRCPMLRMNLVIRFQRVAAICVTSSDEKHGSVIRLQRVAAIYVTSSDEKYGSATGATPRNHVDIHHTFAGRRTATLAPRSMACRRAAPHRRCQRCVHFRTTEGESIIQEEAWCGGRTAKARQIVEPF
jgi:hypothetical protein